MLTCLRFHFICFFIILGLGASLPKAFSQDQCAFSENTVASLIALTDGIVAGEPFMVGLYLNTNRDWHTYSNPSGDTGLPTQMDWELPIGFSASPILWPCPQTLEQSGLMTYVYKGPVLLPVRITPPRNLKLGEKIELKAKAQWLECHDICLPASGMVSLSLPVKLASQVNTNQATQALFDCFTAQQDRTFKIWIALFSAFLGGMILNLMPCVFPVLGIKVMSFLHHSKKSKAKTRAHGLVFSAGVLLSFWVLSGLLLFLRAQGEALGWGFQLQSPVFILFLIALLFLLALMFLGTFEIGLSFVGVGGELSARAGYSGSFFSGILATIVATPCTAPFMGAALGFALTQPAWTSLMIFTVLALGMCTPYLLLTFYPSLLRFLPHPGAWMDHFKQVMAFPMFATVVWLIWVFGLQTNMSSVALVLLGLIFLGMAAWVYGLWGRINAARATRLKAVIVSVLSLLLSLGLFYRSVEATFRQTSANQHHQLNWEPYSPERLAQLRAQNRIVFVDFTAAWCLTCQTNLRGPLEDEDVIQAFKNKNVATLVADWTLKDPVITQALMDLGRSGVPANVFYSPNPSVPPILLSEILTEQMLLDILNDL